MLKDQDKEIDRLLRRVAKSRAAADIPDSGHIDADEISVFAENALPEKARARVTSHLADCPRCRSILSSVIVLRREDEEPAPVPATGAAISFEIPWYKKLFSVRGLATALGVLVVLMAGFLVVSLFRGLTTSNEVAQLENANASAPAENRIESSDVDNNSAGSSVPIPDTAANASSSPESETGRNERADQVARNESAPGQAKKKGGKRFDDRTGGLRKDRDSISDGQITANIAADSAVSTEEAASVAPAPPPPPPATPEQKAEAAKSSGGGGNRIGSLSVGRSNEVTSRRTIKPRMKAPSRTSARSLQGYPIKNVGGKIFRRKDKVWYDSTYTGQSTTNVRRGTPAFEELDNGLRDIAGKLSGTVVIVWKSKAFRID